MFYSFNFLFLFLFVFSSYSPTFLSDARHFQRNANELFRKWNLAKGSVFLSLLFQSRRCCEKKRVEYKEREGQGKEGETKELALEMLRWRYMQISGVWQIYFCASSTVESVSFKARLCPSGLLGTTRPGLVRPATGRSSIEISLSRCVAAYTLCFSKMWSCNFLS